MARGPGHGVPDLLALRSRAIGRAPLGEMRHDGAGEHVGGHRHLAGGLPHPTGGGFSYAFTPDWSPDGTRIVFFLFLDSTGRVDIYTARSDGSHVAPVTATPDFEDFADWGTPPASV